MPHQINAELSSKMMNAILRAIMETSVPEDRSNAGDTLLIPTAEACNAMIQILATFLETTPNAITAEDLRDMSKEVAMRLTWEMLSIREERAKTGAMPPPTISIHAN